MSCFLTETTFLSSLCSRYFVARLVFSKAQIFFFFASFLTTVKTFVPRVAYKISSRNFFLSFFQQKYAWINSFSNLSIFDALFIFLINIFTRYGYIEIFNLSQMEKLKISREMKEDCRENRTQLNHILTILIFQILLFFLPHIFIYILIFNQYRKKKRKNNQ